MTMIRSAGFMPSFRPSAQTASPVGATQTRPAAADVDQGHVDQGHVDRSVRGGAAARVEPGVINTAAAAPPRRASGVRRLAAGIALGVACTLAPAIMLHGGVVRAAVAAQPAPTSVAVATSLGRPAARPVVPVTLPSPTYPSPGVASPNATTTAKPDTAATANSASRATANPSTATTGKPSTAVTAKPSTATTGKPSTAVTAKPSTATATRASEKHATTAATAKSHAASTDSAPAKPADDTILTHIGKDTHVVADKTADAGKAVWHPLKKAGLGIGHFFGKAGHQLKEGWDSKDQ